MKELNMFEKIILWIKSLFINKKKVKENSDKIKRKMCESAVQSGVCPHICDICAWNTLSEDKE